MDASSLGMSVSGIGNELAFRKPTTITDKDLSGYIPDVPFEKRKTIGDSFRLFERFVGLLQREPIGSVSLSNAAKELVQFLEAADSPYAGEALTSDFQQALDAAKAITARS